MEKMTKVQMFEVIKAESTNEEVIAFCDREIALLKNKAEKAKGRTTKRQTENEGLKAIILDTLKATARPVTVTELLQTEGLNGLTNQKVTSLLTLLKADGLVDKTIEKRVSFYFAVEEGNENPDSDEE